jgi:hypothetical protein
VMGQAIRDAQEYGLEPISFRMACRFESLGQRDAGKLRWVRECLEHYCAVMGIDDLQASDMFLDKPRKRSKKATEPEQTDIADAVGEDNVHNINEHRESA